METGSGGSHEEGDKARPASDQAHWPDVAQGCGMRQPALLITSSPTQCQFTAKVGINNQQHPLPPFSIPHPPHGSFCRPTPSPQLPSLTLHPTILWEKPFTSLTEFINPLPLRSTLGPTNHTPGVWPRDAACETQKRIDVINSMAVKFTQRKKWHIHPNKHLPTIASQFLLTWARCTEGSLAHVCDSCNFILPMSNRFDLDKPSAEHYQTFKWQYRKDNIITSDFLPNGSVPKWHTFFSKSFCPCSSLLFHREAFRTRHKMTHKSWKCYSARPTGLHFGSERWILEVWAHSESSETKIYYTRKGRIV